ncbi:hypothetical protein GGTG_03644 [Gaeumannomyces tritici R3-111a-1]|uniref:Uncharacterized protein n=1 Tax=Gaeumannomyces tritici (strain R3-111a-1) TaxID=644352 RepID=J3NQT8_GAET3|nr:hypothetical protein GGTG_03644 [Gaeumannomyces tritici R3-111a-1]EJT78544.1 hypothetical protein GGTG_03644 [Gaeumannomyces tritici R3-111a-1]
MSRTRTEGGDDNGKGFGQFAVTMEAKQKCLPFVQAGIPSQLLGMFVLGNRLAPGGQSYDHLRELAGGSRAAP